MEVVPNRDWRHWIDERQEVKGTIYWLYRGVLPTSATSCLCTFSGLLFTSIWTTATMEMGLEHSSILCNKSWKRQETCAETLGLLRFFFTAAGKIYKIHQNLQFTWVLPEWCSFREGSSLLRRSQASGSPNGWGGLQLRLKRAKCNPPPEAHLHPCFTNHTTQSALG